MIGIFGYILLIMSIIANIADNGEEGTILISAAFIVFAIREIQKDLRK